MNTKEYIVYKITNKINNKIYIGQTSGTMRNRFNAHCRQESNCIKLKNAIKKYGRENFTIEQIDKAYSKYDADNKEIYWIKEYNSTNESTGYNITKGGNNTYSSKNVICIETGEIFDTCLQAGKYFNCASSSIASVCNGYKFSILGKHFAYLNEDGTPNLSNVKYVKPSKIKVICVEKNLEFNSIKEASVWANISPSAINNHLKGKTRKAGGFTWVYSSNEWNTKIDFIPKPKKSKTPLPPKRRSGELSTKAQPVRCLETGKIYTTITEASKDINIARSSIQIALWYPNRTARGYHFEYVEGTRDYHNTKPIVCIETGKIFNSSTEASKFVNKDRSAIRVALREPHRTCGGYHWEYLETEVA